MGWAVALILAVLYFGFWMTLAILVVLGLSVAITVGIGFLSLMIYFGIKQQNDISKD